MNRNNLIDQLSETSNCSTQQAEQMVDAMLQKIAEALQRGEKVDLRGFGSFQINDKKERQGRNPRTGETMTIPAKKVVTFKANGELGERVNRPTAVTADASSS